MGMPGSSEYLQELTSCVLGDLIQEVFVIVIADDLHVCSNTVSEIFHNWSLVLHHMHENNLKLSTTKTVICPKKTSILGWVWDSGTLSVSQRKVSPLCTAAPPKTCTAMPSYISAYKAMSYCIPLYASLLLKVCRVPSKLSGPQTSLLISSNVKRHLNLRGH